MALLTRGTAWPQATPQERCAVQTVTDVFHRRGGEETVPMYRVMLKEPTTLHAPFLIRAPLARVAQRTALCMFYASVPKAAQEAMLNLAPDVTTYVQVHDSGYPEEGPLEILETVYHGARR